MKTSMAIAEGIAAATIVLVFDLPPVEASSDVSLDGEVRAAPADVLPIDEADCEDDCDEDDCDEDGCDKADCVEDEKEVPQKLQYHAPAGITIAFIPIRSICSPGLTGYPLCPGRSHEHHCRRRVAKPLTGAAFSYAPGYTWNQGNGCASCAAKPNASLAYNHTWHDATFVPSMSDLQAGEAQTATLQFNGV